MDLISIIFGVFGGLSLFLFGLKTLSDGLNKVAGERMKNMLEKLTNKPYKGVFVGAFTTSVIQSSSITMVTLIGLINAGLLTFTQAVGVMLGAEIGTTITAQLIAFKVGIYYLPMITIGFFIYFFTKDKKYHYIGQTILGFGILFLGMSIMSNSVKPLRSDPNFLELLKNFGQIPLLGILAGAIFTGIIQSSSATTGLVIAMGMENVITLPSAIALIFGANIGTCVTGLIASIGSSLSSKRTAVAQLMVNVTGVLLFLPFLSQFANIVALTSIDLARQIANAHTIFNVIVTLIMLPLVGVIVNFVTKILPGEEIKIERGTRYIDKKLLNAPTLAISQASKEVDRMANISAKMLEMSIEALLTENQKLPKIVYKKEESVDELHDEIDHYLEMISSSKGKELTKKDSEHLARLNHSITDIERIADHAVNIAEYAEYRVKNNIKFSNFAKKEVNKLYKKVKSALDKSILSLKKTDRELAEEVLKIEEEIDMMEKKFNEEHMKRLKEGICAPTAGVVFIEILRNLERVGDHATNIANAVLVGF